MKFTADTNILVRAVMRDNAAQAKLATKLLRDAVVIAVTLPCLCEFVWVLDRVYGMERADVAAAIEALLASGNVSVNRPAVEAGLAVLKAGGDFADGLIAYEGIWLGGEVFLSFDKKAVALVARQGRAAELLT